MFKTIKKLVQKVKCAIPFLPYGFWHDRLMVVQQLPNQARLVQCQSCGRLFGMKDDLKIILPFGMDLAGLYKEHGEKLKHVDSKHCWCCPQLDYKDPDNGNEVWTHNTIQ